MQKNKLNFFLDRSRIRISVLMVVLIGILVIPINAQNTKKDQKSKGWIAPAELDSLINPILGENSNIGYKLFQQSCAICHGNTGKGDGVAGIALKPRPANLTTDKVQEQSDGAIFWKISNGNSPMPTYENVYTEDQRWNIVKFIRTLKKKR